ncbi:MAG: Ig-like domain-containing protein [Prevotellaceae bacterium]|nr:Ig-like domain-containing protein [Prevotellaceae bacterium]
MKRKILLLAAFAGLMIMSGCSKDEPHIAATGISLNKTELTLAAGGKETLVATITPADATNKNVIWSSSNAYIASVNAQTGEVTAVADGTATITATTQDGSYTATCEVKVNDILRTYLKLDLLQYAGNTVAITYTDGGTENLTRNNDGYFHINKSNKTLKSITLEGGSPILIGRKTDADLTFKTSGAGIAFRNAVNDTVPIGSYAELQLIDTQLHGIYEQEADIDLMNEEWTPIGTYQRYFDGVFNGSVYTLANLKITGNKAYVGLFGASANIGISRICNVHIISGSVSGQFGVGSICGGAFAGRISNCYSACTVSGTDIQIGGICGLSLEGSILNCYYSGVVSNTDKYTGGICGYNYNGRILTCYNTGSVSGKDYAGGISGYNTTLANITACYNMGTVLANNNYAGGICGANLKDVIACYNTGSVSAGGNNAGGVCGRNTANITACYNTGYLLGSNNVGGIIGENAATVTACYWKDVAGDDADYGIGSLASNTGAIPFSASAWPNAAENAEWGIGDGSGSGKYWKSLGGWNSGNPVYPKLYFEQ